MYRFRGMSRTHTAWTIGILVGIGMWLGAVGASAQVPPTVDVSVSPEAPTPTDPIGLTVAGTWPNACVPQDPQTTVDGDQVEIRTTSEGPFCAEVLTDFQFTVELGQLEAGTYQVSVVHQPANRNEERIATHSFEVLPGDPVSDPCVYDGNDSGTIEDVELIQAIDDWVAGSIPDSVLLRLIDWWTAEADACADGLPEGSG